MKQWGALLALAFHLADVTRLTLFLVLSAAAVYMKEWGQRVRQKIHALVQRIANADVPRALGQPLDPLSAPPATSLPSRGSVN